MGADVEVRPVGTGDWASMKALFSTVTVNRGCWCMFFRSSGRDFDANVGDGNRDRMRRLVKRGEPVGLLAYRDGEPVGWASLAPRASHARLRRSPLLVGEFDEPDVWSLLCFYVHPEERRAGVSHALVDAACEHAVQQGAEVLEAMPRASAAKRSAAELYVGHRGLFAAHGFEVVDRRPGAGRIVMRRSLR